MFGRFDLAALCGCHTLNVCYVAAPYIFVCLFVFMFVVMSTDVPTYTPRSIVPELSSRHPRHGCLAFLYLRSALLPSPAHVQSDTVTLNVCCCCCNLNQLGCHRCTHGLVASKRLSIINPTCCQFNFIMHKVSAELKSTCCEHSPLYLSCKHCTRYK